MSARLAEMHRRNRARQMVTPHSLTVSDAECLQRTRTGLAKLGAHDPQFGFEFGFGDLGTAGLAQGSPREGFPAVASAMFRICP
jgi:hypothetical protein